EHTYRGDLRVEVEKDGEIEVLTNGQGGGEDNFEGTFDLSAFDGIEASGTWILRVVDGAGDDVGAILSWGLDIARCVGAACDDTPEVRSYTNDTLGVIPDNDTEGVSSTITATDAGPIGTLRVTVNISHEFPADLVVRLARNDTTVELVNSPNVFETNFMQTFTVTDFNGEELEGDWTLIVSDEAAGDEGTLNSWTLEAVQ
ncbi:MAG: proprotein convertase P-domain-containing protein, partial [Myxococcota bacterium]